MSETVTQTIRRALAKSFSQTENARRSPRCMHVKADGVRCGSPAMHAQPFCYFHEQMSRRMAAHFPPLEDGNAIQLALMQVIEALAARTMDPKLAATILYGLQTASANLKHVRFEPFKEIVTRMPIDEAAAPSPRKPVAAATEPSATSGAAEAEAIS